MKTTTLTLLVQEITALIRQRSMFTCWDITRLLRARGQDVKHHEVRQIVHGLAGYDLPPFYKSDYVRNSMISLKGLGIYAEVYAHKNDNAANYSPNTLKPTKTQRPTISFPTPTTTSVTATATLVKTTTKTSSVKVRRSRIDNIRRTTSRDARGRITINNGFMKRVGFSPGHIVYIAKRAKGLPGLVVLNSPPKDPTNLFCKYMVDRSGNIRISRGVLKDAGLQYITDFKLRLTDNEDAIIVVGK